MCYIVVLMNTVTSYVRMYVVCVVSWINWLCTFYDTAPFSVAYVHMYVHTCVCTVYSYVYCMYVCKYVCTYCMYSIYVCMPSMRFILSLVNPCQA